MSLTYHGSSGGTVSIPKGTRYIIQSFTDGVDKAWGYVDGIGGYGYVANGWFN